MLQQLIFEQIKLSVSSKLINQISISYKMKNIIRIR